MAFDSMLLMLMMLLEHPLKEWLKGLLGNFKKSSKKNYDSYRPIMINNEKHKIL